VFLLIISHRYLLIKYVSQIAFPVKQIWPLEERLCIIEEVEKNPSEKGIDKAK
jgi:hypothetical protein